MNHLTTLYVNQSDRERQIAEDLRARQILRTENEARTDLVRPATTGQRPATTAAGRPATIGQRPATTGQRPATTAAGRPTTSRPAAIHARAAAGR